MKPVIDLRVIQKLEWLDNEQGIKNLIATSYTIQFIREGSDEWEDVPVLFSEEESEPHTKIASKEQTRNGPGPSYVSIPEK